MADDRTHNGITDALTKLASTISPFVMLAFTLIAYIYTSGQSESQEKLNEISKKMDKLEEVISSIQTIQTQHSGRMDRQGERTDEDRKKLSDLEQGQRDLEKTILLYNANRR